MVSQASPANSEEKKGGDVWLRPRDIVERGPMRLSFIEEMLREGILPSRTLGRARIVRESDWLRLLDGEFDAQIEALRARKRAARAAAQ